MNLSPLYRAAAVVSLVATVGCGIQQTDLALKVVDARTGAPVSGADVNVNGMDAQTPTSGVAHFLLRPDTYDVSVQDDAYLPLSTTVTLGPGAGTARTIPLYPRPVDPNATPGPAPDPNATPGPGGTPVPLPPRPSNDPGVAVFGRVTDPSGARVGGAMVMVANTYGVPLGTATSTAQGEYRLDHVLRGHQLRLTAVADGYDSVTRSFTPSSDWRMDFTGQFALKKHVDPGPDPQHPSTLMVQGTVQDTFGNPLDGVLVHIQAYNVRYPFDRMTIGRHGHYQMAVPTDLPLSFTASKTGYRPTTFQQSVAASTFGEAASVDFTGTRALDLLPVSQMGSMAAMSVIGPKIVR